MHFQESDNSVLSANYLLKLFDLFANVRSINVGSNEYSALKKMGSTNLWGLGGSRTGGWVGRWYGCGKISS